MIRRIPQNHRWSGPYLGSYYGDLWKTFNVDLDFNEGHIMLSRRMELIEDSGELNELGNASPIYAFVRTDADCTDRYWALNGNVMLRTDSNVPEISTTPANDWDTDALASSPSTGMLDMCVHSNDSRNDSGRNKLIVTFDTDISVLNDTGNGAWTANWWVTKQGQPALKSNIDYHPVEYFPNRKITLIGDGNLVHTISRPSDTQNDTVTYARLVLPKDYIARGIFATADRAWICCYHQNFESGTIVEWDGFSQSPNRFHNIYGMGVLSGVNYGETPIVLNNKGVFLEYTGSGFVPMVRNGQGVAFPCATEPGNSMWDSSDSVTDAVSPRGMVVGEDGLIYINTAQPVRPSERQSAGIWCLNPMTGRLYNKHSLLRANSDTSVGFGAQVVYKTLAGALYPVSSTVSDRNLLAGGLILASSEATNSPLGGIWLMQTTTSQAPTRGYFITQYIPTDAVSDFWDALWVKFHRFVQQSGNTPALIVKARGTRPMVSQLAQPLQKTVTWSNTTTFSVTLSSADESIQVGDEVEILCGPNEGYCVHISAIVGAHGGAQTVTLDEAVGSGSGTSTARFDRWKKLGVITDMTKTYQKLNVGIDSSFIQFKVELRGPTRLMSISDLVVTSKPSIQLEN